MKDVDIVAEAVLRLTERNRGLETLALEKECVKAAEEGRCDGSCVRQRVAWPDWYCPSVVEKS